MGASTRQGCWCRGDSSFSGLRGTSYALCVHVQYEAELASCRDITVCVDPAWEGSGIACLLAVVIVVVVEELSLLLHHRHVSLNSHLDRSTV